MDHTIHAPARPVLGRWSNRSATPGPLARLLALAALRRSRLHLAGLEDHRLRDVGLSRDQALREARRPAWRGVGDRPWRVKDAPAWDAPAHWLR